jgi:hypothetical protein
MLVVVASSDLIAFSNNSSSDRGMVNSCKGYLPRVSLTGRGDLKWRKVAATALMTLL